MYYLPKQADEKHDFASSEAHGGAIHISTATKSGRLDYVCLGCKKPMQAILRSYMAPSLIFVTTPKMLPQVNAVLSAMKIIGANWH